MATKTENLDLWQWAQTDPVNVDEVNENFQKVDHYLESAGCLDKLAVFTVQSAAAEVDFDLSELALSNYGALQLYFDLSFVNTGATNALIKYNDGANLYEAMVDQSTIAGTADTEMSITLNSIDAGSGIGAKIELFRNKDSVGGLHLGMGKYGGSSGSSNKVSACLKNIWLPDLSLDGLKKITLTFGANNSNQYAAGSVLRIYGVRK
ncbi:MAG: hypothetical protein KH420_05945 [Clostridiales bacterium]|nr:hypothetical protein [Clostridiales bacterium]